LGGKTPATFAVKKNRGEDRKGREEMSDTILGSRGPSEHVKGEKKRQWEFNLRVQRG